MLNSLKPIQDRHFVGPDLGLNCLPLKKLSADETRKRVKVGVIFGKYGNLYHPSSYFKLAYCDFKSSGSRFNQNSILLEAIRCFTDSDVICDEISKYCCDIISYLGQEAGMLLGPLGFL